MHQPQINMQKPDANINEAWALFVRVICALACFPHEAFHQLQDWGSKASVLGRGLAVAISPTISAIALYTYAGAVFGNAAYLLLMPVVVLIIDWQIVGTSYQSERNTQLGLVRFVLALITLFISLYASLLSQEEGLLKALRQGETLALQADKSLAGVEFRAVQAQIASTRETIAANAERVRREAPELKARLSTAQMLYEKECFGETGVDARTGVRVVGGGCGRRAAGHKAEADAARRQLAAVEELPGRNDGLQNELTDLNQRLLTIQEGVVTTKGGIGALFKATRYVDFGTLMSIVLSAAMMLFLEMLCVIFSHFPPAKNLQAAVADLGERDSRRLELFHARALASLNRELPPLRFGIANERSHAVHLSIPMSAAKPMSKPSETEAV